MVGTVVVGASTTISLSFRKFSDFMNFGKRMIDRIIRIGRSRQNLTNLAMFLVIISPYF